MDGNVSVSLPSDGDNYVKIAVGPQSYRVPGPLRGLSGREVLCIGIWRRHDSGDYSATFSRTAGILAMRKPEVDSPSWKLLNAELCEAERVVSTWKVFLHSNMPKHSRFTTAIDQYEVEIMHGSQLTSPHLGSASADDSVKSCASCHPKAVEQWLTSAHSHAMNNLKAKGQDKNPACLSCHTTPRPESGQKRLPATVGVSCHSCHEKGATPKVRTCERCHTTHTDPERRFFPAFSKVCTGDIVNSSGEMTCECE